MRLKRLALSLVGGSCIAFAPLPVTLAGASTNAVSAVRILPHSGRESVLYRFKGGNDGAAPYAALVADAAGNLYGTTSAGGGSTVCHYGGCGTVFRLAPHGSGYIETVLYRFKGTSDGANPEGSLILDQRGDLFGTTLQGGSMPSPVGCGTVFELVRGTDAYAEETVHTFSDHPDGCSPVGALLKLNSGTLLGTTTGGGSSSGDGCLGYRSTCGTVFELKPAGDKFTETTVYSFRAPPDATSPESNLLEVNGSIYGVGDGGDGGCFNDRYDCGAVFALRPTRSGYSESVLTLSGWQGSYGPHPVGGLAANANGDLFGAAPFAFSSETVFKGGIFELEPAASGYEQRYVHVFSGAPNDGNSPESAPIVDPAGIVYGTTFAGGSAGCDCGTIYSLKPGGFRQYVESIVFSFEPGAGGTNPFGSLLETKRGTLLGTASYGGSSANCEYGCGTVFEVTP
jgi:uncharacterized repeat protein (TIGR03803 family)